jgi:hypothetical protein
MHRTPFSKISDIFKNLEKLPDRIFKNLENCAGVVPRHTETRIVRAELASLAAMTTSSSAPANTKAISEVIFRNL